MSNKETAAVRAKLRSMICEAQRETGDIRARIRSSSGMDRWAHWEAKRSHGKGTRYLLLAYAFLRRMPYRVAEAKCAEFNQPSAAAIAGCTEAEDMGAVLDQVKAWLEAVPAAEAAA